MKATEFDKLAIETFSSVLGPIGFRTLASKRSTFYRRKDSIVHIILPDINRSGDSYHFKVYPTSPLLDPSFDEHFPDDLGIPVLLYDLDQVTGVGLDQQKFGCKTIDEFKKTSVSAKAALEHAVFYLDQIRTIQDFVPLVKKSKRGFALYHAGKIKESKDYLRAEKSRILTLMKDNDSDMLVRYLDSLQNCLEDID